MDFKAKTLFNNLSLSVHNHPKSDAIIFYENKIIDIKNFKLKV